ncbi:MAG: hypothetical protein EAZ09_05500 [Oscillatoriales cyanobacterium]|nr:MAG: hypothetical protein EAZ18_03765 [Oscillatoriales cyanobacterium]TAH23927.1 MAG: hypothetical protein EAZ09_05500 [Oscillatoriales cyanobacterium]
MFLRFYLRAHHCQQQAFRPVPPENSLFVEQAGKPVHKRLIENGTASQIDRPSIDSQDFRWKRVLVFCLVLVLLFFSTQTKVFE